jgi:hypothetical protein
MELQIPFGKNTLVFSRFQGLYKSSKAMTSGQKYSRLFHQHCLNINVTPSVFFAYNTTVYYVCK